MSPVIRACEKQKIDFSILHSGQHYDANMDQIFFDELLLSRPKYNLSVGSLPFPVQVGKMMDGMLQALRAELPDVVIVQGDTSTVLVGALASTRLGIPVAHIEAGLRSNDLSMPEEKNRIITDHISEYLFAPTDKALQNIQEEGCNGQAIKVGNTIVDAVVENLKLVEKRRDILDELGLESKRYFLVTMHRAENTDRPGRLESILNGLEKVSNEFPHHKMVFPIHPRTKKKVQDNDLRIAKNIQVIPPVGFLDMLQLEKNAALCLTDSGGLQEECSILHVPCVTLRDNTERPETIDAGMNVLAGTDSDEILKKVNVMLEKKIEWEKIFGDGKTGERIIDVLKKVRKFRNP